MNQQGPPPHFLQASSPQCPECGLMHPIEPGKPCPVAAAKKAQEKAIEDKKKDLENIKEKKDKSTIQYSDLPKNQSVELYGEIDKEIKKIVSKIGVDLTRNLKSHGLDESGKEMALNKYRLIIQQRLNDVTFQFIQEFKL